PTERFAIVLAPSLQNDRTPTSPKQRSHPHIPQTAIAPPHPPNSDRPHISPNSDRPSHSQKAIAPHILNKRSP
ncbi:MAG: hypothetical protein ACKO2Z_19670, partial [Sphaerospermopsis kisseleviana]